jgi:hypothetical protein
MTKSDPVATLEARVVPQLQTAADALKVEFPTAHVAVESHPVGRLTSLQGHLVAISVVLPVPDQRSDQPDHIALSVGIRHLTTRPELDTLDVCWGHPSGYLELDLLPKPIALDESAWRAAEEGMPALVAALRTAIQRGQPPAHVKPVFPC